MNQHTYSIHIKAPRETVWNILWSDATYRDWSSIIDPGTHMVGEMKQGNTVQFISSVGGYGVTSLIEKLVPNETVTFRHVQDTQDNGENTRDDEWSGGTESYTLEEHEGITKVTVMTDVPPELESIINESFPKALERIKALSEEA